MKHFTLLAGMALTLPVAAQIAEGNFEAGPGSAWTEASTNFTTPYCDASCSPNPEFVPFNGSWYLWFGGAGGANAIIPEEASAEQTCTVPAGTDVTLSMWVKYPAPGTAGDYLRVLVDGNVVGEILPADSSLYEDYTGVGFDINAYAGGSHTIRIESMQTSSSLIQSVLVDQVEILADGAAVGLFDNEGAPGIQVFPNPANDNLTLTFNALSGAAAVTITDLSGKIVSAESLGEVSQRTFNFDSSNLENGVYMVTIQNGGDVYTQRVVVSH
ncbi:MAG: T9SS type A sorting domain-containing protein [Flavobacteriales bacterium]|nr:T9SS type A sorting domain-containing protein [Flavobacteriales bacterium]